ncbi:CCR4-NOT transcription complex subunit 1 [Tanacetum coccineum]
MDYLSHFSRVIHERGLCGFGSKAKHTCIASLGSFTLSFEIRWEFVPIDAPSSGWTTKSVSKLNLKRSKVNDIIETGRPCHGVRYNGLVNGLEVLNHEACVKNQDREALSEVLFSSHLIIIEVAISAHLYGIGNSVLGVSMEMAIKEIVSSIVQCSVSIATQITKELILKEPLRGSISSQLRNNLQSLNVHIASDLLEHAIQLVTNDNLDLGCALIEQAATEKAMQTIDNKLAPQLAIRRKHREGVGPAFFDASLYTQGHVGLLPEALRPKPGFCSLTLAKPIQPKLECCAP